MPEWLVVWKWRPTETSRRRTPLCWLLRMCPKFASRSASTRCTSSSELLVATSPRRQAQALNRRCELSLVRVWRSAASRTSRPRHLTPVAERVVAVVDVCKKIIIPTEISDRIDFILKFSAARFFFDRSTLPSQRSN